MNDQDKSSSLDYDPAISKYQVQKEQCNSALDSNGSDSSSSSSQVKIIIENHKNDNETNSKTISTAEDEETKNENSEAYEQRTSVIVQPSRIPTLSRADSKSPPSDKEEEKGDEPKSRFICESKLSQSIINNLFNSSIAQEQSSSSNVRLRPSVLRIGENTSPNERTTDESSNNEETSKELKKDTSTTSNLFKFPPLTGNKKSTFGSMTMPSTGSSIMGTTSTFGVFGSGVGSTTTFKEASTKSSFLTNNGDEKTSSSSTTTNYFTENLFQQVAAQTSSSNNSPETTSSIFGSLATSNSEAAEQSGGGSFVFGQNLQDRVTNVIEKPKPSSAASEAGTSQTDVSSSSTDTATSTAATNSTTTPATVTSAFTSTSSSTGVPEKRKFENITGEEEETNVMHIYCKLFHWDTLTSSWKERGKGNLRLNDKYDEERTTSRLIMRTTGSLKLILNCLIISGMKFELTNNCIRFSNVDGIYLVKGKQNDIEQIYSLIEQRLKMLPKKSKAEIKQKEEEDKSIENSFEIKEKLRLTKDDDESRDMMSESNEDSSFKTSDEASVNREDDEADEDKNVSIDNAEEKIIGKATELTKDGLVDVQES